MEDSLRRLDTDWIDLYQVHRPDHGTDVEETLAVLGDLVRAGKIRAFGCSTFPAEELVEAYHVSERRALPRSARSSRRTRSSRAASRPTCSPWPGARGWAS